MLYFVSLLKIYTSSVVMSLEKVFLQLLVFEYVKEHCKRSKRFICTYLYDAF